MAYVFLYKFPCSRYTHETALFSTPHYFPVALQLHGVDTSVDVLSGVFDVSLVSLLEVDDAPDFLHVLQSRVEIIVNHLSRAIDTHVSLNVLVLEVESMLPDIDTNERNVRDQGILVRRCGDFNALRLRVHALRAHIISLNAPKIK